MKTITVKVKFRMWEEDRNKTVKLELDFPDGSTPCFPEMVDEVYKSNDPKLNGVFGNGYIIGVEQILN